MNKLIVVLILAGIQVCWGSGALAQDRGMPPTGAVVRSEATFTDQQMALMNIQIDSRFGSQLAHRCIAARLGWFGKRRTQMPGAYPENSSIGGPQLPNKLVGHWMLDLRASREESLVWVWTSRSELGAESVMRGTICSQSEVIRGREDH